METGKEGSFLFLLGLSGQLIHIHPPNGGDGEAVPDRGVEQVLCHILWGELLAESPQAFDLFLLVLHQNRGPGDDGGPEIGGIVVGRRKTGVILVHKGDAYAGISFQQLHLAALAGTMEV